MSKPIEDLCVELERQGWFRGTGNFNAYRRTEFWKRMNVRLCSECWKITENDVQSDTGFDKAAKQTCIRLLNKLKAESKNYDASGSKKVEKDKTAATTRPVPPAGGSSSALQSEVEQLRSQLRREKRRVEELQADKKKLGERVGEIENEWRPLYKKLALACHPDTAASHSQRDTTALFQAVGSFNDTMKTVVDPVHVV